MQINLRPPRGVHEVHPCNSPSISYTLIADHVGRILQDIVFYGATEQLGVISLIG